MNKLLSIQNDVTRMANAISSAINIEVVIVDNNLRIISGTGRYADRVGLMEENGDITTDRIYASIRNQENTIFAWTPQPTLCTRR